MVADELLTKNFWLSEFLVSETAARRGIDNTPTPAAIRSLKHLCENLLQPLRDMVQRPVIITSGYRSPALNAVIPRSSPTSQHSVGEAADFYCPGMSIDALYRLIASSGLPYDQLIEEYGSWVHVSHRPGNNRRQFWVER